MASRSKGGAVVCSHDMPCISGPDEFANAPIVAVYSARAAAEFLRGRVVMRYIGMVYPGLSPDALCVLKISAWRMYSLRRGRLVEL